MIVLPLWIITSSTSLLCQCVVEGFSSSFATQAAFSLGRKGTTTSNNNQLLFQLAAAALEVDATSEVVLGSEEDSSSLFLIEAGAIAVPRGVAPGCLTGSSSGGVPIIVEDLLSWKAIYDSTLPERKSDLVWVITNTGQSCAPKLNEDWQRNGTVVLLGGTATPNYVYGKHAVTMKTTLKNQGITDVLEVESWSDLCDIVAQATTKIGASSNNDNNHPRNEASLKLVPIPTLNLVCTGEKSDTNKQHQPKTQTLKPIKSIIVVGGGILGSSIGRALAQRLRGDSSSSLTSVTVYDPTPTGGLATPASWAWLNANSKPPQQYKSLNQMGLRGWRLDPLLSKLKSLKWSGTLVRTKNKLPTPGGYTIEGPLSAKRIQELEPQANFSTTITNDSSGSYYYYYADEGHVDPQEAVSALRQEATVNGGVEFVKESVVGLVRDNVGRVLGVTTASGKQQLADVVIVAAGANSSDLGGGIPLLKNNPSKTYFGNPITSSSAPAPVLLNRTLVDMVSSIYLAQRPDGTVVAGGGAIKFGLSASNYGKLSPNEIQQQLQKAQKVAQQLAPNPVMNSPLTHAKEVVSKPMPLDGFPILGFVEPHLYTAVTHSGMTLSPLIGQLVAAEVLEEVSLQILDDYRPSRFNLQEKVLGEDEEDDRRLNKVQDWQEKQSTT